MPKLKNNIIVGTSVWLVVALLLLTASCGKKEEPIPIPTDHEVRSLIIDGNKNYNKERYAEAATAYGKALMLDTTSLVSMFNLATALMRQGDMAREDTTANNPINQACGLLAHDAKQEQYSMLASMAFYDLGNVAYSQQKWGDAVELYKNALRRNPDDDEARDNLRLAQLKKKEQDQQKNQDKNNNQNDQNQDQQDKQDQNKQNQDKQDQDKKDQDKQNQDKDKGEQSQQDQKPAAQEKGERKPGEMSQQNADQVLKAMQNQEQATLQRVNARKAQQQRSERARTSRRW